MRDTRFPALVYDKQHDFEIQNSVNRTPVKNSMKIPADSFIDPRKISHYLLRPLEESDKSEFLADAGYELADSQRLLDDIRTQLLPLDAEHIGPFEYGEKFRIRGFLQGPNGLRLQVVSIWATLISSGQTRFITLYPDKP